MRLTFFAPAMRRPVGGAAIIYEFASAMARRGHEVHLMHLDMFDSSANSADDIDWFDFDDSVEHYFLGEGPHDSSVTPDADVMFGYAEDTPAAHGLPAVLIQGYRMLGREFEETVFRYPCPKICVAQWLVDVGRSLGVPAEQLVHVPLGLHHETFRLHRPVESRPPIVSFCYNNHEQKGAHHAIGVLERLKQAVPEVEVHAFGSVEPERSLPEWVQFRHAPPQRVIVEEIYNRSRIFLMPSRIEGFGLPALEAMACGAALVTTDNGGSQDYAVHGETAMVSQPGDRDAMVANVLTLLEDEDRRAEMARRGLEHARTFTWERSAELLEQFLERYCAAPARYRR